MFKVPDWGNDIPKGDVDVVNLFTKKNKKKGTKNNVQGKSKDKFINQESNHKKKNAIKKNKNRVHSHVELSKDDHIKNRILRKNMKTISVETKNKENEKVEATQKSIQNGNILHKKKGVNNIMKNKIVKRKGRVLKHTSNIEDKKVTKGNDILSKKNNNSFDKNNCDKKQQHLKRKAVVNIGSQDNIDTNNDMQSLNTDDPDILSLNAKRKKLNEKIINDDIDGLLFGNKNSTEDRELNDKQVLIPSIVTPSKVIPNKDKKINKKKKKLKNILQRDSNRNIIKPSNNKLRERMLERLKAAQFRYLNEKLYTSSGLESEELFKSDPVAFQTYHEGYQLQVKKWPVNPLDLIVKRIQNMPKTHLIADMGCGEAALSKRVSHSVRSFDLVATAPGVEACNMAHTPLLAASMDVVVFCLALMGTDLTQYLLEANRVLKIGGHLLIAEVESRFENVDSFSSDVQRLGFSLKKLDESHKVFFFMEFNKIRDSPSKKGKLPTLTLKPCLYKKR